MKIRIAATASLLLFACVTAFSQTTPLPLMNSATVSENSVTLANPWAGGFNLPQFSSCDMNQDGRKDLAVYDRQSTKMLIFLKTGTAPSLSYTYAPQYSSLFPRPTYDIGLMADLDCDGLEDFVTSIDNGLKVYRHTLTGGTHAFVPWIDTLRADLGLGPVTLFCNKVDIPWFGDVDGDLDADILAFDNSGSYLVWYRNTSQELTGSCSTPAFVREDACFGKFFENGISNTVTLNAACKTNAPGQDPATPASGLHAGSSVCAFDNDNDGDLEIVLGDLTYDNLVYLWNNGTPTAAHMDSSTYSFPAYDVPVTLQLFPSAFAMDVNEDGLEDLIASNCAPNISLNYQNAWLYENTGTQNLYQFSQSSRNFLQREMMDAGSYSRPAFLDYNGDGLQDLVIGNYKLYSSSVVNRAGLTLYENTGTATQPVFTLITRDYLNLTTVFNPSILGMTPAFGDMDNDGDMDMILGDLAGRIHYFNNLGGAGNPVNFVLSGANYKGIDVGQNAVPTLGDVNNDGLMDIVIGEIGGRLRFFPNIGTASLPDFSATAATSYWGEIDTDLICCVGFASPTLVKNPSTQKWDLYTGAENGDILLHEAVNDISSGPFPLSQAQFGGIYEGLNASLAAADIDGDGYLEYAVGNIRGGIALYDDGHPTAVDPAVTAPSLYLWPNPGTGLLTLSGHTTRPVATEVYDMQGQLVRSIPAQHLPASLDLQDLPAGLYLLRTQGGAHETLRYLKR